MKKTLITTMLIALSAAIASAATASYTPLASADGWTYGSEQRGTLTYDTATATMKCDNVSWGRVYATKSIGPISLTLPTDSLTFSFTMGGDETGALSVTLVGSEKAIAFGYVAYGDKGTDYAVTTPLSNQMYTKEGGRVADADIVSITSDRTLGDNNLTSITYTVNIACDTSDNSFKMSVYDGVNTIDNIDLGTSLSFDAVTISADGWGDRVYTISDIELTVTNNIPEPATATLSLLALAGLAARRRRK